MKFVHFISSSLFRSLFGFVLQTLNHEVLQLNNTDVHTFIPLIPILCHIFNCELLCSQSVKKVPRIPTLRHQVPVWCDRSPRCQSSDPQRHGWERAAPGRWLPGPGTAADLRCEARSCSSRTHTADMYREGLHLNTGMTIYFHNESEEKLDSLREKNSKTQYFSFVSC